jgi:Ran GTPase-activating protein (RanGAP) involved in mRNA processing and transport
MGCNITKTVKLMTIENSKLTANNEQETVKEYYTANQNMFPKRIRDLFQRVFMQQNSAASAVDLKFINLSGPGLKSLEVILPCFPQIRVLNLWKTKLGNEGCVVLANLFYKFASLNFLSLADNRITLPGILVISKKFIALKELETLELHINPLQEEAAIALAEKIKILSKLKRIYLDECEMCGEGLKELLVNMSGLKELEVVALNYNFFGDTVSVGLVSILSKFKKLREFEARHTGINATVQESLRKFNSKVNFHFS